ncbi:hypothetical protein Desku_2449 [Desulfofundulus kuznetsovii DSM 6115]|uniref:Uncharacterized protein n=1 Tax=Desulfofundulus kuznetsovii (strain DSM 6115 / VKM B-1805 / 17) TaxID=760568 RepID=A0AAU8PEW9_DESK7|nr:hypothetical protein Desku_2449 [Desulfofundulus kuznetsovii DSM 6115]
MQYVRLGYRQRVVYLARVKGGVGATTLALNLAWRVSEKAKVLLIDTRAAILGFLVCSDVLDILGVEPFEQSEWETPRVLQLSDNLYFLPYPSTHEKYDLDRVVLEARRDYDAIIVDLPPLIATDDTLKSASAVVFLYGGGASEGRRLLRLINHCRTQYQKEAVYVSTVHQPLLNLHKEGENSDWIHLPRGRIKGGIFDAKDLAGRAITEIIREVWGKDLESEKQGFFARMFRGS